MKTLLSILLLSSVAFANQSLNMTSTTLTGTLTIPAVAIFNSTPQKDQNFRVEIRVHNVSTPSDSGHRIEFVNFGGLHIQFWETGEIIGYDEFDPMTSWSRFASYIPTGHNDIIIRLVRNVTTGLMPLRVFDASNGTLLGGHCGNIGNTELTQDCTLNGTTQHDMSGLVTLGYMGGTGASPVQTAKVAWLKVFSTVPPNDAVISGELTPADIADYRFEGNLNNIGTGSYSIATSYPSATYSSSIAYSPTCSAGASQIIRAGASLTLDGTGAVSNNGNALSSYVWQLVSGPSTPTWSSHTVMSPVVSNIVAGGYTFQYTVTDTDGATSTCTTGHGAVSYDSKQVVITENPYLDFFFPSMVKRGQSQWPWWTSMVDVSADNLIAQLPTTFYPIWRNLNPHGTISIPAWAGGAVTSFNITGTGTQFQTDYCGGSTTPTGDQPRLVVRFIDDLGQTVYRPYALASCNSQTSITLNGNNFITPTSQSGLGYSIMYDPDIANWSNQSNNVNYYDVVLGYYALYYQTGLPKYLTAAHTLADSWWESTIIQNGNACYDRGFSGLGYQGGWCLPPRMHAIMGLLLRATERSDMWPGIFRILDYMTDPNVTENDTTRYVYDVREQAAQTAIVCTGAAFATMQGLTPTNLTRYKTFCHDMVVNKFYGHLDARGGVLSPQYGQSTVGEGITKSVAEVAVVQNSPTVTATVGTFTCGNIATGANSGFRFWAYFPNSVAGQFTGGDTRSYSIDTCTPTTLTLHEAYLGTSKPHSGGATNSIGGTFTQPFMMGYLTHTLALADKALTLWGGTPNLTAASNARSMMAGLGTWLPTYGYRPVMGGLFYDRDGLTNDGTVGSANGGGGCEPDPETANNNGSACTGNPDDYSTPPGARFLGGEIFGGMAAAYLNSLDSTLLTNLKNMFGKVWGCSGGPGSDGICATGSYPVTTKSKDFGFPNGWGGDYNVDGAILGGPDAAILKTYKIPFRLANFANAGKVRITVTNASGASTPTVCTTSPCSVTPDARQGTHAFYKLEYLTAGNAVISSGDMTPLTVQP